MRIRYVRWQQDGMVIRLIYQNAFAGFPWHETLSDAEVQRRWEDYRSKRGSQALVAERDEAVIGALLWDQPTLDELGIERGETLARFAEEHLGPNTILVWEREVIVSPAARGQGIGTALRRSFLNRISGTTATLILTRMRDDNLPIIHIAKKLGFLRTGIRVPSSQIPDVSHEYWYLLQEGGGVS